MFNKVYVLISLMAFVNLHGADLEAGRVNNVICCDKFRRHWARTADCLERRIDNTSIIKTIAAYVVLEIAVVGISGAATYFQCRKEKMD